jgi:hypothetical protein
MKCLVALVQQVDGIVFGGYVRDSIIHDHYASEFYNTPDSDLKRYNDPKYLPETADRLIIPNDIDCYMLSSQLNLFKEKVKENRLYIVQERTRHAHIYIPDVNADLLHTTLKITFAINPILFDTVKPSIFEIKIDIIHGSEDIEPPFGTFDFECNTVVLTTSNEYKLANSFTKDLGAKRKHDLLNTVIKNIIERKTKIIYDDVSKYRVSHMIDKKWDIEGLHLTVIKQTTDDNCFICMESLTKNKPHTKFKCCNGRMHMNCARRLFASTEFEICPYCRQDTPFILRDKRLVE